MGGAAERNAALIRARTSLSPRVGLVLGSGLGGLAESVEAGVTIPYCELEDFPHAAVSGHSGKLVVGTIAGTPVAALAGREHYYERGRADAMRGAIETLRAIGVDSLILTNAAGSLQQDIAPGAVMLITDHIGFGGQNPLIGERGDTRFIGMTQAYDAGLQEAARRAAAAAGITISAGVYIWFSGPSFETPAEIRAARLLGADAAGMSTVPEVIIARFLKMRVLAFSVITNYAAGMTGSELSHQETMAIAPLGGRKLARLLTSMLGAWPE